ncbi:dimethylsulfonioproprionate lyase family protein [Pelagibius sp.]|uniref:dimethylsulfonioproprionate lyase family protein n=1 Tax=Pelagibius sp. TaxID=1931238 RepID=UPI003BB16B03
MQQAIQEWATAVGTFIDAYCKLLDQAEETSNAEIEAERRVFRDLLLGIERDVRPETPTGLPVCRFADAVLQEAPSETSLQTDLNESCRQVIANARWVNKYEPNAEHADLFENFAFCDFVGPDSSQVSHDVTLGFVLLGPDTSYPFHEHPARELYYVASGKAGWATDFEDFTLREPGTFLLHLESQPHAMRTYGEPLLAVSAWRGEVRGGSRFSQKVPRQNVNLKHHI